MKTLFKTGQWCFLTALLAWKMRWYVILLLLHYLCNCLLHIVNNQPLCGAGSFGKIHRENRKDGDMGEDCLVTVDGKDFETDKQGNVKIFWVCKFKNSGLCYEFAFCIKTGWLVWIHGPFPCGNWPDINRKNQKTLSKVTRCNTMMEKMFFWVPC